MATQAWIIEYWAEDSKKPSVESWLDGLTKEQLKSIAKELKLLAYAGNTLRLPHSRPLGKGLFELRDKKFGFRIYYAFVGNKIIVLLHAGDKSSQRRDIEVARKRLEKLIKQ